MSQSIPPTPAVPQPKLISTDLRDAAAMLEAQLNQFRQESDHAIESIWQEHLDPDTTDRKWTEINSELSNRRKTAQSQFAEAFLPKTKVRVKKRLKALGLSPDFNGEDSVDDVATLAIWSFLVRIERVKKPFAEDPNDGRIVYHLDRCIEKAILELRGVKRPSRAKNAADKPRRIDDSFDLETLSRHPERLSEDELNRVAHELFPCDRDLRDLLEKHTRSNAGTSVTDVGKSEGNSREEVDNCVRNMIAQRLGKGLSLSEIKHDLRVSSDKIDKHIGPILLKLGIREHFGCDADNEIATTLFLNLAPHDDGSVLTDPTFERVAREFEAKTGNPVSLQRIRELVDRGLLPEIGTRLMKGQKLETISRDLRLPEPFVDDLLTRCITRFMFFPRRKRRPSDGERGP